MSEPEKSMLSLVKANEDGSYTAKKYCDRCGDREEFVGNLIAVPGTADTDSEFCVACLGAVLQAALRTPPFRPAEIAGDVIPPELIVRHGLLPRREKQDYILKAKEFAAPAPRLYCVEKDCGAFIPAEQYTGRAGLCSKCGNKTCKTCRLRAHRGACQPDVLAARDAEEIALLGLVRTHGWQYCPHCDNVIEKDGDTCRLVECLLCGHTLCYPCGIDVKDEDYDEYPHWKCDIINEQCSVGCSRCSITWYLDPDHKPAWEY